MDEDNTERNYRLPQFDRRKAERRRGEDRRDAGRNRLQEFRARRDGLQLERRRGGRRYKDRIVPRRGGLLEELRRLIIRRLVRVKLYGEDERVRELDGEIEIRRRELKARAEAREKARDVSRNRSTSVESQS